MHGARACLSLSACAGGVPAVRPCLSRSWRLQVYKAAPSEAEHYANMPVTGAGVHPSRGCAAAPSAGNKTSTVFFFCFCLGVSACARARLCVYMCTCAACACVVVRACCVLCSSAFTELVNNQCCLQVLSNFYQIFWFFTDFLFDFAFVRILKHIIKVLGLFFDWITLV